MSFNIKVNPFAQVGEWNSQDLDAMISVLPGLPTIQDVLKAASDYVSSKMYNAAIYAAVDSISIQENMASVINYMTSNSWCQDCCDTTFDSLKKLKGGIDAMGGYTTAQKSYINQYLSVPCNPQLGLSDLVPILRQLQTSILIDMSISETEKSPLLVLSAISQQAIGYWDAQSVGGPATWNPYMTPLSPSDWVRPFWLYNMLGAIIGMHFGMQNGGSTGTNLSITGLSGGMVGVAGYAIFK
jgi:hypothetical protein